MAGYRRVRAGLETSLRAAREEGTIGDLDRGVIGAARVLADRLDDNIPGDNVSHSVYLKYMQALGFTPMARGKVQAPVPVSESKPVVSKLAALTADMEARGIHR